LYDPMAQLIQPGSAENIEARQMIAAAAPPLNPPLTPNWYTPGGTLVRAGERIPQVPQVAASTTPNYAPATPLYAPGTPLYGAVPGAPLTPPAPPPPQPSMLGGGVMVGGVPQMLQAGGGAPYIIPQPIVYQAPAPNAPTTIVIDTSPQAMEQSGYQEPMQAAARGVPVMGSGQAGGARRHTTPRARPMSPRRGPASVGGYTAGAKITINKLG
jgi:hypothetical protein